MDTKGADLRKMEPTEPDYVEIAKTIALIREIPDSTKVIELWLCGKNPDLDDRAPVIVLFQDPIGVRNALNNFIAYG